MTEGCPAPLSTRVPHTMKLSGDGDAGAPRLQCGHPEAAASPPSPAPVTATTKGGASPSPTAQLCLWPGGHDHRG